MKKNAYSALEPIAMGPTVTRKLLAYEAGEKGYTVNFMTAKAGTSAPLHSHPHVQIVYMLTGSMDFQCGEEVEKLVPGDVVEIPGDVPHTSNQVHEDSTWLEFFVPEREDFKPEI